MIILDASAFYAGVPFGSKDGESYVTTPAVYGEVSHIKQRYGALEALLSTGRLRIVEPASESMDAARRVSGGTGDMPNLSEPDISVIALCMATGLEVVTDDYAVANVLRSRGLQVTPVMTRGIADVRVWSYYCPGCRTHTAGIGCKQQGNSNVGAWQQRQQQQRQQNVCTVCGSELRRRRRRRMIKTKVRKEDREEKQTRPRAVSVRSLRRSIS